MPLYSHSKIKTFEQCPWQFRLMYLDKIETAAESIEIFLGHRVHEALEALYRALSEERRVIPIESLVADYHAAWDARWHDEVFIVRTGTPVATYRALGEKYIRDYAAQYGPFDPAADATVALEEMILFPLDDTGRVQLRGVIDRLARRADGVWEIHDYKTAATLPSLDDLARDRQLALYQLAVQHAHPEAREVDLVWHYLAHGREIRQRRSQAELDALRVTIAGLVEMIEARAAEPDRLPPRESALCAWCAYPPHCPAKKHVYNVRRLAPEARRADPGVRLVDAYAQGLAAGSGVTGETAVTRARLCEYAVAEGLLVVEGTGWRARILGDEVTLEAVRYADRRC